MSDAVLPKKVTLQNISLGIKHCPLTRDERVVGFTTGRIDITALKRANHQHILKILDLIGDDFVWIPTSGGGVASNERRCGNHREA
ncbi:MAG: hypothetical protein JO290_07625 [Sphingomonadaceae bacterium]|nr:hypothetical protein [Sphingomonadaceae bacterium]